MQIIQRTLLRMPKEQRLRPAQLFRRMGLISEGQFRLSIDLLVGAKFDLIQLHENAMPFTVRVVRVYENVVTYVILDSLIPDNRLIEWSLEIPRFLRVYRPTFRR